MRPMSKKRRVEILRRVARHIRRWPHLYSFFRAQIPKKGQVCEACMLARAGVMMGVVGRPWPGSNGKLSIVATALGFGGKDSEDTFYTAIRGAIMKRKPGYTPSLDDAAAVAAAMEDMAASL